MNISIQKKITILGIGSLGTLMILLMLEVAFAQILTDTLINNISDNLMLLIIMMGMFLLTVVIAVVIGYYITADIRTKSVFYASVLSLGCLILFLFIISNVTLYANYYEIYVNIHGFEILPVFPQVLINFAIYILGDVFNLFILIFVSYYIFFIFFIEKLYVRKIIIE